MINSEIHTDTHYNGTVKKQTLESSKIESWALKNWCFWTVVLVLALAAHILKLNCGVGEDSESPLDCKETQPVHPKGDQSWVFIGRTDVEAETPILWPPDVKSWLIRKDPDAEKDWGQEEKGMTEDEMVGWHHWLNGHRFGWIPGAGNGQGGLACGGSRGRKDSDTTEWLNWTKLSHMRPSIRLTSYFPLKSMETKRLIFLKMLFYFFFCFFTF